MHLDKGPGPHNSLQLPNVSAHSRVFLDARCTTLHASADKSSGSETQVMHCSILQAYCSVYTSVQQSTITHVSDCCARHEERGRC